MSGPTRRHLLAASAVAAATPAVAETRPAVLISTWDFGVPANAAAHAVLRQGGTALDMVEAGARLAEADPANASVGLGGYPDREGRVTLDAIIMNGRGDMGAVCALEDVVHAISVARRVMEATPHVMLVGEGARAFALDQGFEPRDLLTPQAEAAWRDWLKTADYAPRANSENSDWRGGALDHDTIGILGRTPDGAMAGACTTSGLAFKMRGRVGDSPIPGAGLYVDDEAGGATATGLGEDILRVAGAHAVVEGLRVGLDPVTACRRVVERLARMRGVALNGSQVGFIALDRHGRAGGCALRPGFSYAITDADGTTRLEQADALLP